MQVLNNSGEMIIKLIITGLIIALTGCSSIAWEDGTGKKITYRRLGSQELKQLEVNMKTGKVSLGSSKGDTGALSEAILNLSKKIP